MIQIENTRTRLPSNEKLESCRGLVSEIKQCRDLRKGKQLHLRAVEVRFHTNRFLATVLIGMYSKFGCMGEAQHVFDSMVQRVVATWNSLMLGYVENGRSLVALELFARMDCPPNHVSFLAALMACGSLAREGGLEKRFCLERGMEVHREALKHGFGNQLSVASTLIDMYGKCGSMDLAERVFNRMRDRNAVAWNSLMLGFVENGEHFKALEVFSRLDCAPNRVTFIAAIKSCAGSGVLEIGQKVHEQVRELGLEKDEMVATCLVDFYGKCGEMEAAEEVFEGMKLHSIVSWTALIGGYSMLGRTFKVFSLVKRMEESGLQINGVTALLVLAACSHAGMVEEGWECFRSMSKHGIVPGVKHYTCMVDILGRANRLQEALRLIEGMPLKPDSVVWLALLGACRKWNDVGVGKVAFDMLVLQEEHEEHARSAYLMMGNIYKKLGMKHEEEVLEMERQKARAWKRRAIMTWWCDGQGRIHNFMHHHQSWRTSGPRTSSVSFL